MKAHRGVIGFAGAIAPAFARSLRLLVLLGSVVILALGVARTDEGCFNGDSPGCPGFLDAGSWDPDGITLQEIAQQTVGTTESLVDDGGKPYYQIRLGVNSPEGAQFIAALLAVAPDAAALLRREAWCSETVSYWHREARLPYATGYRNSAWQLDWQLPNTTALRTFYRTEEAGGGRGRWVDWSDLDYANFVPGINAPVPGAYQQLDQFGFPAPGTDLPDWLGNGHSQIIDEMTVYRTRDGRVQRVAVTILEGNSGRPGHVRNDRSYPDLLDRTLWGSPFIPNNRKIRGWGIDLDGQGQPVYDRSKLHEVIIPDGVTRQKLTVVVRDREAPMIARLASYARVARSGPAARSSSPAVRADRVPDGDTTTWIIPGDIDRVAPAGVTLEVDLRAVHPLLVRGVVLHWRRGYIPRGLRVQWAGADARYKDAVLPSTLTSPTAATTFQGSLPVSAVFGGPGGQAVRYLRLILPRGAVTQTAVLTELRFRYNWGSETDAQTNP